MTKKRALITGITGQDGSYLADLLLQKGYKIFGLERRSSQKTHDNIKHLLSSGHDVEFISGDLLDEASLVHALRKAKPQEVYNLAAQSFVMESWKQPVFTGEVTGLGAVRMLEAVRQVDPKIRFYQASSSEMFGAATETPQNEQTPFHPRSPYGVAKLYAHWITVNYRESYGMFTVSGILFNHESPRRGLEFVTRKIAYAAACIKMGIKNSPHLNEERQPLVKNGKLAMGTLDAKRDWGFAGDYVEAMWRMLQQKTPHDYVIGTGVTHTVREFAEAAFGHLGLDYKDYITLDKRFIRPAEVVQLHSDPSRAMRELSWKPIVDFKTLVAMMVDSDMKLLQASELRK